MLKLKNMNEKRFVGDVSSVEDYVESLENWNTKEKTKRDVKDIEPAELNKHLAGFIRSKLKVEENKN